MVASWLSFDEALWWISSRRYPALTIYTSLPMLKMEFDTDLWALNWKWTTFISWWPTAPTLHHGGEPDWLFWCWWDLVDSWTLDITGWWKDRLRFSTPTGRSTLSLPVPVYLVKPAWPWRWLRYKIENRLKTVYVYPLLGRLLERSPGLATPARMGQEKGLL